MFPTDQVILDLLDRAVRPGPETEHSVDDLLGLVAGLVGAADPDERYHTNDVIGALVGEIRRLRGIPPHDGADVELAPVDGVPSLGYRVADAMEAGGLLDRGGEHAVRKRCVVCGSGPLKLAYRPLPPEAPDPIVSTPLNTAGWWPMSPALDARLTCEACGNSSYGRLVGGHVANDGFVHGHFVPIPHGRQLEIW